MTFVLLNSLLDRTLDGMAAAGKNVIAFGSGLVLASLLVPVKKRITGRARADPVPRHLPRAPGAARHRARLRDAAPARGGRRRPSCSGSRRRCASCPARSSSSRSPGRDPDAASSSPRRLAHRTIGCACAATALRRGRRRPRCCASTRSATAPSSPCAAAATLVGALGVGLQGRPRAALLRGRGAADGRPGAGEPRLRERAPLRRARRAAGGDPDAPGVPGERHPLLVLRASSCSTRDDRIHSANPAFAALVGRAGGGARAACRSRDVLPASRRRRRRRTAASGASRRAAPTPGGEERDLQLSVSAFQRRPGPPRRRRRRHDRPHPRRAGAGRARAPRLARRARGRRRARGQHADRRPLVLRADAARRDVARATRATRS